MLSKYKFLMTVIFLTSAQLFAQVDAGSINGQVQDMSGAVISGALITLQNEGTGVSMSTKSDVHGNYSFAPVRVGSYALTAEQAGFAREVRAHVVVSIQQNLLINVALQAGKVEQTIAVTTEEPVLQTQSASVGQVVAQRQINDLPLNGRNYFFLAQLAAGVSFGQKDSRGEDNNGRFAANGSRATENNYLLDGMDNNSSILSRQNGKDFVVQTPVDALSEFKIQTNNYTAQFGRSAGAVMNATVKSGTNDFHGNAWEFIRNDALDANDYFQNQANQKRPEYRRNQFGFTQGGPLWIPKIYDGRNRTFFFVDYEGTRIRQGNTQTATVPTLAERSSGFTDFSDLVSLQTGSYIDAQGKTYPAGTIFDPATTTPFGNSYVRAPFTGNIIPNNRIDPVAVKLLSLLPAPTKSTLANNYVTAPVFADDYNSFDVRIDQMIGSKDQLFGRYSYNLHEQNHPGPFPGYADGGNSLVISNMTDRSQNLVIGETHIFSPSLVNEIRMGVNREHALWLQPFGNETNIPEQFGILGVPQGPQNGGLPGFSIGSLSSFGSSGSLPSSKYGTVPQFTDDLTYLRGAHTFKFGFEGQQIRAPFKQPPNSRGRFSFSGTYTSVVGQTDGTTGQAQMLLSPTASSNIAGADTVSLSTNVKHYVERYYFGGYAQDDWKVNRQLTLNVGVRYDYYSFPSDQSGQLANFVPGAGRIGGTYLVTPQIQARLTTNFINALTAEGVTVKESGQTLGDVQKLNFAPRLGFAFQANSRAVLRGGYGISYGGIEEIGGSPLITENFPIEYNVTRAAASPVTPIVADNSLGLLENTFQNLSIDPATVNVSGIPLVGFQHNWKTPYTQNENLVFEYQVSRHTTWSIGYVGSNTRHLETVLNPNMPFVLLPPGTTQTRYIPYPATALANNYQTVTQASANYNSLQTTLEKRLSHGFILLANFTWQKTRTDARDPLEGTIGGYRAPYLPGFGLKKDFALADFDVRHIVHVSGIYELPIGPGRALAAGTHGVTKALIGGWNLNWIATIQEGQPFTVPCARATTTGFGCNALLVPGQNPYSNSSVAHFLNATAFTGPTAITTAGQQGIAALGGSPTQVTGPPFRRLDISVFKRFGISERIYMEFRTEVFNLTNTANFANPTNLTFTNLANFGQITATRDSPNDPREIQFGLKLYW